MIKRKRRFVSLSNKEFNYFYDYSSFIIAINDKYPKYKNITILGGSLYNCLDENDNKILQKTKNDYYNDNRKTLFYIEYDLPERKWSKEVLINRRLKRLNIL